MASITNIPPNRAVALLTPTVFAPLAGAISVAAAKYAPGLDVDATSLQAIFIAGATIAFGNAGIWLKGWQDQEKRDAEAAGAAPAGADFEDVSMPEDLDIEDEDDIEDEAFVEDDPVFEDEDELAFLADDENADDEFMALSAAHEE